MIFYRILIVVIIIFVNSICFGEIDKKHEIENSLKKFGISKEQTLWLKYSMNDIPSLTKIKIKDFDVYEGQYSSFIEIYVETDERDTILRFDYSDKKEEAISDIKNAFYTKNSFLKWGRRVLKAIEKKEIFLGMTKDQVIASWGLPGKINQSVGGWGVHEQWIYGDYGPYLYFENNKLKSWQD